MSFTEEKLKEFDKEYEVIYVPAERDGSGQLFRCNDSVKSFLKEALKAQKQLIKDELGKLSLQYETQRKQAVFSDNTEIMSDKIEALDQAINLIENL